jgi:hypothetical protein
MQVVDLLELVDVQDRDRERLSMPLGEAAKLLDELRGLATVWRTGQVVRIREAAEELRALEPIADARPELGADHGLVHEVVRARLEDAVYDLRARLRREEEDRQTLPAWVAAYDTAELHAGEVGHVDVEHQQIRLYGLQLRPERQGIVEGADLHSARLQKFAYGGEHLRVVVHREHAGARRLRTQEHLPALLHHSRGGDRTLEKGPRAEAHRLDPVEERVTIGDDQRGYRRRERAERTQRQSPAVHPGVEPEVEDRGRRPPRVEGVAQLGYTGRGDRGRAAALRLLHDRAREADVRVRDEDRRFRVPGVGSGFGPHRADALQLPAQLDDEIAEPQEIHRRQPLVTPEHLLDITRETGAFHEPEGPHRPRELVRLALGLAT